MHTLICRFFKSFPRIFDGKRYKLINFAPKTEMVDNCLSKQIFSKLALTAGVDNIKPQMDKLSGKEMSQKF